MTQENLLQIVTDTLRSSCGVKDEISSESELLEDLKLDSMGMLALAVNLENQFRIQLPEDPENPPETVNDVVLLLEQALGAKST